MSDAPPISGSQATTKMKEVYEFIAIAMWLLIQFGALALASSGWTPYARFGRPAATVAVEVMTVTQIAMASLLFPVILRNMKRAAIAIGSVMPFVMLSAMLAEERMSDALRLGAFVIGWTIALALLARELRTERQTMIAVAIVSFATLAGPVFGYLQREFGNGTVPGILHGPLMARGEWSGWVCVAVVLGVALAIRMHHNRSYASGVRRQI